MKKILIIEDEPQIRDNVQELLRLEDFYTIVADNGIEGLELAKEFLPDLIICDVVMPDLDGYGVLHYLRQNTTTETIPFIFLTAKIEKSDLRYGMELGADDYLMKPFTPIELRSAITTRLEKQAILQRQSQQKLDDLRHTIAYSLPHELNTPLTSIIGFTQLLREHDTLSSDSEAVAMLNSIEAASKRLSRLMQNFLQYAELELMMQDPDRMAGLPNNAEQCFTQNLVTVIAQRKAMQVDRAEDLQLELHNSLINISEAKLIKVIEEIVDNAFKFSASGTSVRIVSSVSETQFHLFIIDQGQGMTREQIASIGAYMQFQRKLYEQQGSGLGLSIAKRIVELQGGELAIESFPGQQTIVRISLPYLAHPSFPIEQTH